MAYCPPDGVDIGAVVADIGAHAVKIGFAGEDMPRAYFPSHAGVPTSADDGAMDVDGKGAATAGASKPSSTSTKREYRLDLGSRPSDGELEVTSPLVDGLVDDWDLVEQLWRHANRTSLSVDLAQTPVLLVERAFNTSKLRQEYAELMFETFRSPALFLSKDSVLSCFACGKTTGLVVDVGGETTTVGPVLDGWLESKGLVRSHLAGRALDRYMLSLLEKGGIAVHPILKHKKEPGAALPSTAGWTASFKDWARLEVARGLRESVCRMPEAAFQETDPKYALAPKAPYELPDGTQVAAGLERFQVPEAFMNPDPLLPFLPSLEEDEAGAAADWSCDSLPKMVADACLRCDRDQQLPLLASVVLSGGGACIEGLQDRLKTETETVLYGPGQGFNRVKVLQPGVQERRVCAWLGGSIVASLGSFHEMWVSRQEYAERGAGVVDTKCP